MRISPAAVASFLVSVWAFAVLFALLGFYVRWESWPAAIDAMMSVTFLAPLALPKSFSDLVGATELSSTRGTVVAAVLYWPAVVAFHWLALRTRSVTVLFILLAILSLSGWNWFVVGTAMMGL